MNKITQTKYVQLNRQYFLVTKYYVSSSGENSRLHFREITISTSDCYSSIVCFVNGEYFQPTGQSKLSRYSLLDAIENHDESC